MLESKKQLLKDNEYLRLRKEAKNQLRFDTHKRIDFFVATILSFLLIFLIYFLLPISNIYHISVEGNIYLSNEDIVDISGLSTDNKFYLFFNSSVEKKMKKNPLINEVEIQKLNGNLVKIIVKETKQIGYIYEDNTPKILLVNDSRVNITKDNMYLISKVPLIDGYDREQLKTIEKGFVDVDYKLINEISEIHRYPFSYDDNMMEVIMRDGNFVFVSYNGLKLLDNYYSIISSKNEEKNSCVFFDELTYTGILGSCPWENIPQNENTEPEN